MKFYNSPSGRIFDFFNHILLILLCTVMVYPFWYVFVASLSTPSFVATVRGMMIWPVGVNFGAYERVLQNPAILSSYMNTLFYVGVGTLLNLLLTSFAAYALSRRHLWGRFTFMKFVVFTMFFSGGMIPLYLMVRNLGLLNSRWVLIVYNAIITFNFIVMRTSFASMPDSLEESAKLDGANDFLILFRIYLPLALPVVAVMCLFYGVYHWNSWFWAMVFLRERALFPLQLILREILIANDMSAMMNAADFAKDEEQFGLTIQYATIVITMAPITLLYPFLQRYFIRGMMVGSIKE
jgi:putative aldouronate transport system permease protein